MAERTTITEALSEINLIKKKVVGKRNKVMTAIGRPAHQKDPFESDGGSVKVIATESQAINDLNRRLSTIRAAISEANLGNSITLGEDTRTIHDWLTWKREVAKDQIGFVKQVHTASRQYLDKFATNPQVYKDEAGNTKLVEVVTNVDYGAWVKFEESLSEKLEQLDGKLSLKNATILVTV